MHKGPANSGRHPRIEIDQTQARYPLISRIRTASITISSQTMIRRKRQHRLELSNRCRFQQSYQKPHLSKDEPQNHDTSPTSSKFYPKQPTSSQPKRPNCYLTYRTTLKAVYCGWVLLRRRIVVVRMHQVDKCNPTILLLNALSILLWPLSDVLLAFGFENLSLLSKTNVQAVFIDR